MFRHKAKKREYIANIVREILSSSEFRMELQVLVKKELAEQMKTIPSASISEEITKKITSKVLSQKPKYKYLGGKSGTLFANVSDTPDGCYFRMFGENGNSAKFEYCGTLEKARNNFNAIFDKICETSGNLDKAIKIVTEKPGSLKRRDDGKWELMNNQKAIVKFV